VETFGPYRRAPSRPAPRKRGDVRKKNLTGMKCVISFAPKILKEE
jgi:hypothetical protein